MLRDMRCSTNTQTWQFQWLKLQCCCSACLDGLSPSLRQDSNSLSSYGKHLCLRVSWPQYTVTLSLSASVTHQLTSWLTSDFVQTNLVLLHMALQLPQYCFCYYYYYYSSFVSRVNLVTLHLPKVNLCQLLIMFHGRMPLLSHFKLHQNTTATTAVKGLNHIHFTALFPGPPRWAGARRKLLDFMVQGKINRGKHTDHPAGRHSIRTNQCPPPPSPHILYRPDALPVAQPTVSKHWRQLAHSD